MTPEQLTILKNYITSDPVLNAYPMDGDGLNAVADALNAASNPAFYVWKSSVSVDEIMRGNLDWSQVDNLSVGKARIWDWMTRLGSFNPSKQNIRAGIDAAWAGTAAMLAVRATIYALCNRPATVAEKLLATGTGTTTDPALLGLEGKITANDVDAARRS